MVALSISPMRPRDLVTMGRLADQQIGHVARPQRDGAWLNSPSAVAQAEDREPDRLLGRQHLRRPDRAGRRLKKATTESAWNNMITALGQDRGRDGRVEPYNAIAEADERGEDRGLLGRRQDAGLRSGMISSPGVPMQWCLSQGLVEVASDFKNNPNKVADDLCLLHLEGLFDVAGHVPQGDGDRRREPRLLRPQALQGRPRSCSEKKIAAIPDWSKAAPDFMEKARSGVGSVSCPALCGHPRPALICKDGWPGQTRP